MVEIEATFIGNFGTSDPKYRDSTSACLLGQPLLRVNKKVTQLYSLLSCVNLFRWGWGHLEATIMRGSNILMNYSMDND